MNDNIPDCPAKDSALKLKLQPLGAAESRPPLAPLGALLRRAVTVAHARRVSAEADGGGGLLSTIKKFELGFANV